MSNRLISLTEKSVDIMIGDVKFAISRLTLSARDLVTKYRTEAATLYADTQVFLSEIAEGKDINQIRRKTETYRKKAEEGDKKIHDLRIAVIKKMLDDNGIEYNDEYWQNVDVEIPDAFINAVMSKNEASEQDVKKGALTTQ